MGRTGFRSLSCALALVVVAGLSACSGDDESSDTTAPAPDPMAEAEQTVQCADEAGDAAPFPGMEASDEIVAAADLESVTLSTVEDGIEVRFVLAGPAVLGTGDRSLVVAIVPVSGELPEADLRVTQTANGEDRLFVTVREDGEAEPTAADTSEIELVVDGNTLSYVVPVEQLGPAVEVPWRWSASVSATLEESIAQDACGTSESGGDAETVYQPGVRTA